MNRILAFISVVGEPPNEWTCIYYTTIYI